MLTVPMVAVMRVVVPVMRFAFFEVSVFHNSRYDLGPDGLISAVNDQTRPQNAKTTAARMHANDAT